MTRRKRTIQESINKEKGQSERNIFYILFGFMKYATETRKRQENKIKRKNNVLNFFYLCFLVSGLRNYTYCSNKSGRT